MPTVTSVEVLHPAPAPGVVGVVARTGGRDAHAGVAVAPVPPAGVALVGEVVRLAAPAVVGADVDGAEAAPAETWRRLWDVVGLADAGGGLAGRAVALVANALWDLWARREGLPLWRLLADLSPLELAAAANLSPLADQLNPSAAVSLLEPRTLGRSGRAADARREGFPACVELGPPAGVSRARLRRARDEGWRAVALDDPWPVTDPGRRPPSRRRASTGHQHGAGRATRSEPPSGRSGPGGLGGPGGPGSRRRGGAPASVAAPLQPPAVLGSVREALGPGVDLVIGAGAGWGPEEAAGRVAALGAFGGVWVDEPVSGADATSLAALRAGAPEGVAVRAGSKIEDPITFKQLIAARAVDACVVDACRLSIGGALAVLLLAARANVPVHHAAPGRIVAYASNLALADYVAIGASVDRRLASFPFDGPIDVAASVVRGGRYMAPDEPGIGAVFGVDPER